MINETEKELDFTKLKYVLYARRSTTDKERQIRSIPDQIRECQLMADSQELRIIKVLQEKKSAKKPEIRPIYRQMILDIGKGIYDGIIAWNPDRLARNMLEGGQIINLIDEGVIKDLKFKTHYFTNDANGKMLLGMAFVLSKQYSDDLSQKVTRGTRSKFADGKSHIPKHGYVNDGSNYRPDGKNFDLIQEAWSMRLDGDSLKDICVYLNKKGYGRKMKKKGGRVIKMTPQILSGVFKDPIYYGLLIQASQQVDLRSFDKNFKAMVEEKEWNTVQLLSRTRQTPYNTRKRANFYPFKTIIKCEYCDHNMFGGPSKSQSGKRYLYFRCDNASCSRKGLNIKKSIRAKVIMEFLYDFFKNDFKLTQKDYEKYHENLKQLNVAKQVELKTQIRSLQGSLTAIDSEINQRSLRLVDSGCKGTAKKNYEEKIEQLDREKESISQELERNKKKLGNPEEDILSLEQFLNLVKNAENIIKSANPIGKDTIVRLIFLNLFVDGEKVTKYRLKEPFNTMHKTLNAVSSRGYWIRTSNLMVPNHAR